jgi:hypothetical protein
MRIEASSLLSSASVLNRVASVSGLTTGATAARIESVIRLSLRHDATEQNAWKAAFASEHPGRNPR